MLRSIYLLFTFLSLYQLEAQVIYNGHLYEAGTQLDVSGAKISLISTGEETISNTYGDFILKYGESDNSKLQFFDNSMVWSGEKNITIKMIGLDGSQISTYKIRSGETFLFPRLKIGIYLVTILEGNETYAYKIMSDGVQTINVDKRKISHQNNDSENTYDTLLIEKEGYYPRKTPVLSSSKVLDIGMLKGDYEQLDYFNELIAPVAYELIKGNPSRSNLGNVQQVKIIYDTRTDLLYYMNSQKYSLHLDFSVDILGFKHGHFYFNQTQYTDNPNRYLYLASLNYYQGIEKYVLQYVTAVEMTCEQIQLLYDKILETSFLNEDQLSFFPIKTEWEQCTTLNKVSSEELYQGQTYQGLNITSNYGYLKKVPSTELDETYVSRRDIVLTDGVPNDLPVVAGIITSELQTPLSHINVLSHSRNTPNMALRGAWESDEFNALVGKLVYLNVRDSGYELREATIEEALGYWEEREPQDTIYLKKNLAYSELVNMEEVNFTFVDRIGGKAANFGELLNVRTIEVPTPENAFGIPFYYYHAHMESYGLNQLIEDLIVDPQFLSDAEYRKNSLEQLKDSIIGSPINQELVSLVTSKINSFSNFEAFRFRSSTNAEDLEEFSGAGLYDSYSAKKNHETKTIEAAIKKVWASLWNWRAFEERDYFKIDHLSCAMGILVHRSFPDEDANGVLVSKNLYNTNPGYTINVQHSEHSIVFPEPGIINDQMILFTWSINSGEDFMLEYLSFSNIPELNGNRVMTDEEVFELGYYVTEIKKRFYYEMPHNCNCTFNDFGVDIEFKVDSEVSPRKIYIKQARLY